MAVRFVREHNRTATDIFNNMIRPHLTGALDIGLQKMTYFNKHNHTYQNRTGALENSVSWDPAKQEGDKVVGALIAGGLSRATITRYAAGGGSFTLRNIRVPKTGKRKKGMLRYKKIALFTRGDQIYVDYAAFVELKGFPVLVQGIEKYKHEIVAIIGTYLRQQRSTRLYTFKFTGETKDIYGGS